MDSVESRVVAIIQSVVNESGRESGTISAQSSMGNPRAWDSLVFVEVFETIASEFDLDVSDDDAVHFMSVAEIVSFIQDS